MKPNVLFIAMAVSLAFLPAAASAHNLPAIAAEVNKVGLTFQEDLGPTGLGGALSVLLAAFFSPLVVISVTLDGIVSDH